jgi:hypothetical protein
MTFSVNWRHLNVAMQTTSWNWLHIELLVAQMIKNLTAICCIRFHNGNKKFWEELIAYFPLI